MIDLTFGISNGDCELIVDDENMVESCIRRLNTEIDTTLYDTYGGNLRGLLGLKKTEVNLEFLNQSITDCLLQDERISECNITSEYTSDGFKSDISIVYLDNELTFEYNVSEDMEE